MACGPRRDSPGCLSSRPVGDDAGARSQHGTEHDECEVARRATRQRRLRDAERRVRRRRDVGAVDPRGDRGCAAGRRLLAPGIAARPARAHGLGRRPHRSASPRRPRGVAGVGHRRAVRGPRRVRRFDPPIEARRRGRAEDVALRPSGGPLRRRRRARRRRGRLPGVRTPRRQAIRARNEAASSRNETSTAPGTRNSRGSDRYAYTRYRW